MMQSRHSVSVDHAVWLGFGAWVVGCLGGLCGCPAAEEAHGPPQTTRRRVDTVMAVHPADWSGSHQPFM
jgi:hypothetical protein